MDIVQTIVLVLFLLISDTEPSTANQGLIQGFKDYTLDTQTSSCKNVNIDMSIPDIVGLIHSPDSGEACKWTFTASEATHIHITFIEYSRQPTNYTYLKVISNSELWLTVKNDKTKARFNFTNNLMDDSFDLKRFTDLESVTDRLSIEYEPSLSVQFLIFFRSNKPAENELTCTVGYELSNSNFLHSSQIPKNLLCRCADGDCEYLAEFYSPQFEDQPVEYSCSYYVGMDEACKQATGFLQANIGTERILHKEMRPISFQNSVGDQCGSLVYGNEYGWISSPEFSSSAKYAGGMDCFYTISLQPNQIVQLRFINFLLNSEMVNFVQTDAFEERSVSETPVNMNVKTGKEKDGTSLILSSSSFRNIFKTAKMKSSLLFGDDFLKVQPYNLGNLNKYRLYVLTNFLATIKFKFFLH